MGAYSVHGCPSAVRGEVLPKGASIVCSQLPHSDLVCICFLNKEWQGQGIESTFDSYRYASGGSIPSLSRGMSLAWVGVLRLGRLPSPTGKRPPPEEIRVPAVRPLEEPCDRMAIAQPLRSHERFETGHDSFHLSQGSASHLLNKGEDLFRSNVHLEGGSPSGIAGELGDDVGGQCGVLGPGAFAWWTVT